MSLSSAFVALASGAAKALADGSADHPDRLRQRSASMPNQIQLLTGKVCAGKGFTAENGAFIVDGLSFPQEVEPWSVSVGNLAEAVEELKKAERDPRRPILVLGCPIVDGPGSLVVRQRYDSSGGYLTRTKHNIADKGQIACFAEVARHLYVIDFDPTTAQRKWCESRGLDVFANPEAAVRACVEQFFPTEVRRCTYAYQLSASCGLSGCGRKTLEAHHVKFHLFVWLRKPQYPNVVKAWIAEQCGRNAADRFGEKKKNGHTAGGLDLSLYQAVQPCFISVRFSGCADPLAGKRWGTVEGECEVLDLVLTDGKNGELQLAPDECSSTYTTAAIQIGRGPSVRRISWAAANDGELNKWPSGYKARLALIAQRGTHVTCFYASRPLGRQLVSTHGDGAEASDDYTKAVQEFFDAIDSKPRSDNSRERIAHHRKQALEHIAEGIARARVIIAERKTRRRRVVPHFANEETALCDAEARMQKIVDGFILKASQRMNYALAFARAFKVSWLLPETWPEGCQPIEVPRQIIAATTGAGKTRASLLSYLKSGLAETTRLYYFVPTHKKASELKADFDQLASDLGVAASASIFSGITRGCLAKKKDKARYDAAMACADVGISPKTSACVGCPFAANCSWLKQADDSTPGLKIVPTAYLGFAIPGFAETDKGAPPILGAVIDEDFIQSLKIQRSAGPREIPLYSDFQLKWLERDGCAPRDLLSDADKWSLSETANAVRKLFDFEGPLNFERFDTLIAEHARRRGVVEVCDLLKSYVWDVKKLVAARVRDDLEAGRRVGFEARDVLRRVTFLSDLLQMMRTVRFARRDLDETTACKVEHAKRGAKMHLLWYRRLAPTLASLPLLYLDATTELELAKLPFQQWDELLNADVDLDVEFEKIDIAAPHQKLVKVINAPVGKRAFDEAGTEWKDTKKRRRKSRRVEDSEAVENERESEPKAGKTRVPKRMHNNAAWADVLRVGEAICGRAVVDGHEAGLISYKGVEAYAKRFGFFNGVHVGHFGSLRGVNAWERCRVLVTVGRTVPVDGELENEAEARFVLDRHGRRPSRGLGIKRVARAIRVAADGSHEPDGISVDVEEPACPLVAMVYRAVTTAEVMQAVGRARGVRRGPKDEVLVMEFSPVFLNATYAAVVDWNAFGGISEIDAVIHSQGVVPLRKPGHLKALAPWCFGGVEQTRGSLYDRTERMFANWPGRNEFGQNSAHHLYRERISYIGNSRNNDRIRYAWPNFSSDTVIYGDPSTDEILKAALLAGETYRAKGAQDSLSCVVDANRRTAAASALKRATGCVLGPASRGAPRKALPSPAALRMRALRERKKAGHHRKPRRGSGRNRKISRVSRSKAA